MRVEPNESGIAEAQVSFEPSNRTGGVPLSSGIRGLISRVVASRQIARTQRFSGVVAPSWNHWTHEFGGYKGAVGRRGCRRRQGCGRLGCRRGQGCGRRRAPRCLFDQASASLHQAVDALEPDCLSGSDAKALYRSVVEVLRLATAAKIALATRIESAGIWKESGHRNAATLIAETEGVGVGHARSTLETGRALVDAPKTAEALRDTNPTSGANPAGAL
jgi:hypothetical protein